MKDPGQKHRRRFQVANADPAENLFIQRRRVFQPHTAETQLQEVIRPPGTQLLIAADRDPLRLHFVHNLQQVPACAKLRQQRILRMAFVIDKSYRLQTDLGMQRQVRRDVKYSRRPAQENQRPRANRQLHRPREQKMTDKNRDQRQQTSDENYGSRQNPVRFEKSEGGLADHRDTDRHEKLVQQLDQSDSCVAV